uniref:FAS1 domain-containing protein n=1 Tax=Macrostomum lignano TaxID=282301 RepID=A0A1I8F9I0_9PLAT
MRLADEHHGKLQRHPLLPGVRPSNTALDDAYKADSQEGLPERLASQGTPVGEDIGFGQVIILRPQEGTLYWAAKQTGSTWSYRVNNAAVVQQGGRCRVFHVLDQVLLPIGSTQDTANFFSSGPSSSIANQLGIQKSLAIFNDWMQRDTTYSYVYSALRGDSPFKVRTIFLPSDAAWDRIPSSEMQKLSSSAEEFRKVLVAHFAPDIAVFTTWMNLSSSIKFSTGAVQIARYSDSRMYLNSAARPSCRLARVCRPVSWTNPSTTRSATPSSTWWTGCSPSPTKTCSRWRRPMRPGSTGPARGAQLPEPAEQQWHPADAVCTRRCDQPGPASSKQALEQLLMLHFVPGIYYVEGRLPGPGFVPSGADNVRPAGQERNFPQGDTAFRASRCRRVKDFINSHEDLSSVRHNAAMAAFSGYKNSKEVSIGAVILRRQQLRNPVVEDHRLVRHGQHQPGAGEYECTNGMVYPSSQVLFRDNDDQQEQDQQTKAG